MDLVNLSLAYYPRCTDCSTTDPIHLIAPIDRASKAASGHVVSGMGCFVLQEIHRGELELDLCEFNFRLSSCHPSPSSYHPMWERYCIDRALKAE